MLTWITALHWYVLIVIHLTIFVKPIHQSFSWRHIIQIIGPADWLALKWLDFWYFDQGRILSNYGIEGVFYELDSAGQPQRTERITITRTMSILLRFRENNQQNRKK